MISNVIVMHTTATNRRARIAKYAAFARLGFAEARAEPAELYARVVFFFIILGVFSALWRAVAISGASVGGDAHTLVWYLAMTEWVLLSAPHLQFAIEDEIRRGDVAYQFARPVSYLGAHFARGVGALAARAPILLAAAFAAGWVFGGGAPAHPAAIVRAIAFGSVASVVLTSYNLLLGLGAFWLGDIAPAYWIWQKLTFVLGGLMLPLSLYPDVVVRIARMTPFPALLTGPASFVLDRPFFGAGILVIALVGWFAVAGVLAVVTLRRAARELQVNGG
jgi:ABC-2 type transport system permease protein